MNKTFTTNGKKYQTTQEIYALLNSVKSSNTAFLMVFTAELDAGNIVEIK
jgi:hypothetical protein